MSEEHQTGESEQTPLQRIIGRVVMGIGIAIALFVFITGMYISLAAYTGQSVQFINYENWSSPILLTGIILILFGVAAILYPTGPSEDGLWVLMTGPYVR